MNTVDIETIIGRPAVTCVCVTRNRRRFLPEAIDCYRKQTYTPRKLLIVADGEDVSDLIPREDQTIRYVHLADRPGTVGDKRNIANNLTDTELIAHWDDDDYSKPDRLTHEIGLLAFDKRRRSVIGYHTMLFTADGKEWWQYNGPNNYAAGTSLLYKRDFWAWHPFNAKDNGEDGDFVWDAWRANQLITTPNENHMYATIHEENTCPYEVKIIMAGDHGYWSKIA